MSYHPFCGPVGADGTVALVSWAVASISFPGSFLIESEGRTIACVFSVGGLSASPMLWDQEMVHCLCISFQLSSCLGSTAQGLPPKVNKYTVGNSCEVCLQVEASRGRYDCTDTTSFHSTCCGLPHSADLDMLFSHLSVLLHSMSFFGLRMFKLMMDAVPSSLVSLGTTFSALHSQRTFGIPDSNENYGESSSKDFTRPGSASSPLPLSFPVGHLSSSTGRRGRE